MNQTGSAGATLNAPRISVDAENIVDSVCDNIRMVADLFLNIGKHEEVLQPDTMATAGFLLNSWASDIKDAVCARGGLEMDKRKMPVFAYDEAMVRTVDVDGEPWFVGRDVANALGYSNTKDALAKHVDDEDKAGSRIATQFGEKEAVIINESGLYSLIFGSKLDGAKKFKRWVTSEVLPSIRRTGGYGAVDGADIGAFLETATRAMDMMAQCASAMGRCVRMLGAKQRGFAKNMTHVKMLPKETQAERRARERDGVLHFVSSFCDVTGSNDDWCKLSELYRIYKRTTEKPMQRLDMKDCLFNQFRELKFHVNDRRRANVFSVEGIKFKDDWQLRFFDWWSRRDLLP